MIFRSVGFISGSRLSLQCNCIRCYCQQVDQLVIIICIDGGSSKTKMWELIESDPVKSFTVQYRLELWHSKVRGGTSCLLCAVTFPFIQMSVWVFAVANPSVVCNIRTPYSDAWNFRLYFCAILYLSHPLTSMHNFTEIVPGEPLSRGH